MSATLAWTMVASSLALIVVRRRSIAIALVAGQSFALGAYALTHAHAIGATAAGATLIVKAILLPGLLLIAVRRSPKSRPIVTEPPAFTRLALAAALALAIEQLMPPLGLQSAGLEHAAVGVFAIGILLAVTRRAVLFQALGFLLVENGIYLASLSLRSGLPVPIELGIAFDLIVTVSVAAAFATKIHERLGSGDSSLLEALHD